MRLKTWLSSASKQEKEEVLAMAWQEISNKFGTKTRREAELVRDQVKKLGGSHGRNQKVWTKN